jgi:hypothetical protein
VRRVSGSDANNQACGRYDAVVGSKYGGSQPSNPIGAMKFFVA